jgi:hypothetical protein
MSKQRALVVGVSNYPKASWALPGVANDAREMAALLGSPQGQFEGGEVTVLTHDRATVAAITAQLNAVLGGAGPDEAVFVFLAGHGICRNDNYYFVAYDTDLVRLDKTGVPLITIRDLFERCASRQVFVWLDFCHSGGIVERAVGGSTLEAGREVIDRTLHVVRGRGKVIVAACLGSETAKESKALGHGYFTHALVEGLKGLAVDVAGQVTATSLYGYIVRRVEAESHEQCPVLYGRMQGEIVLMHHDPRSLAAVQAGSPVGPVCDSSGDWALLHDYFVRAAGIEYHADGTLTVEVTARSAAESAAIQLLHPGRPDRPRSVAFAHGDDGLVASVIRLGGRTSGSKQVWSVTLKPEDGSHSSAATEANVQGHSAEEIAQMRAGRLLLNDPPPPATCRQGAGFDMVEMYVRGVGTRFQADACILKEVYASYQDQPDLLLPYARLRTVYALKVSRCVEQVLELRLGPVYEGKCHVRFRGRRARRYSNVDPFVISLEGDCPLE